MEERRGVGLAMPFAGMTLFWAYFRYPSFFGVWFPPEAYVHAGPLSMPAHAWALVCIAVLSAVGLTVYRVRPGLVVLSRRAVLAAGAVGLASVVLAWVGGARWLGVAAVGIAACFVATYLGWAQWFSTRWNRTNALVLAASFLASLALSGLSRWIPGIATGMALVVPPLSCACLWLAAACRCDGAPERSPRAPKVSDIPPYMVLYTAFLVVGAIMRGIVDSGGVGTMSLGPRLPVSLGVAGLLLVACVVFWHPERQPERFAMGVWASLALLFCAGVFWSLANPDAGGGQLVVVARSTLDFMLWFLLCDLVWRRGLFCAPVFLLLGLATEVVAWLLSYAVVPWALAGVPSGDSVRSFLELGSLGVLMVALIAVMGLQQMVKPVPAVGSDASDFPDGEPADAADLLSGHGLSPREREVVEFYARGMSIKRVGTELGISTGTVQSYLKGAYRKLDVHSRDELIDLLGRG